MIQVGDACVHNRCHIIILIKITWLHNAKEANLELVKWSQTMQPMTLKESWVRSLYFAIPLSLFDLALATIYCSSEKALSP